MSSTRKYEERKEALEKKLVVEAYAATIAANTALKDAEVSNIYRSADQNESRHG